MSADSETLLPRPAQRAGALTFSLLFSLESLTRSFNASVLPIQAYDLLGSSRGVSLISTAVSLSVLTATLMMPMLIGHLRRRWTYTIGVGLMIAATFCLASFTIPGQALGAFLRNTGASILNITLSLYILDNIRRSALAHSESIRLTLSTFSWMAGPSIGVWLYSTYGPIAPQIATFGAAILLLAVFWTLRLRENTALPPGRFSSTQPTANVSRFMAQPRLRLAWAIAFGRSCFWSVFFIYGPLLFIEGGLGKQAGALIVSASQAVLLTAFIFGRIAQQIGVRPVITLCFLMIAITSTAAGLAGKAEPMQAAVLLLLGSLFASGLDGVGNVPFLRAVRYNERQRMTSVYRTFIEFSELIPGAIFAVLLSFFPTETVFIVLGVSLLLLSAISWRYLPRSL